MQHDIIESPCLAPSTLSGGMASSGDMLGRAGRGRGKERRLETRKERSLETVGKAAKVRLGARYGS